MGKRLTSSSQSTTITKSASSSGLSNQKNKKRTVASRAIVQRAAISELANFGIESLEGRQLMSTVNVADFGATGNDGRDDTAAITAAINSAHAGDTISFGQGTYNISSRIDVHSGLKFTGVRGKTVIDSPGNTQAFYASNGSSVEIDNFNFVGGVCFIDGKVKYVMQNNDVTAFDNSADIGCGNGAVGGGGAQLDKGSYIYNNNFHDSQNGRSIYFFTCFNTTIEHNTFNNVFLGIKSNNSESVTAENLTIHANAFIQNRYHSVEVQGNINGFWFTDNYYAQPRLGSDYNSNTSTFAFSLIYVKGSYNQHILRNYINTTERPDGTGVRLAFEAGENTQLTDNYINGTGTPITVYAGGTTVDGNYISNALFPSYCYGGLQAGSNVPSVITNNNNTSVKLDWDTNRAMPGYNSATGGIVGPGGVENDSKLGSGSGSTGGGDTGGTTTGSDGGSSGGTTTGDDGGGTTTTDNGTVTGVAAKVIDDNTVKLNWTSSAGHVKYYRIEIISTVGREQFKSVIVSDASATSAKIKNLHSGWQLDFTVVAVTKSGEVRSDARTVQMSGDSTVTPDGNPKVSPPPSVISYVKTYLDRLEDGSADASAAAASVPKIRINGKTYNRSTTTTDGSTLKYNLGQKFDYFCAYIGQDDLTETKGVVKFEVIGDGKTLYTSDIVNNTSRARKIKVNVDGVKSMWLVVTDATGTSKTVKADWAVPYLLAA